MITASTNHFQMWMTLQRYKGTLNWWIAGQWMYLQPNALKTKYIIISRKRWRRSYPHLFLNRLQLEQEVQYLGVVVNESLSWSHQTNCVSTRAKRTFIANFAGFAVEVLCSNFILHWYIAYSWVQQLGLGPNHIYWKTLHNSILFRLNGHKKLFQSANSSPYMAFHHWNSSNVLVNSITHIPNNLFMYRTSGSQRVSHDLQLICLEPTLFLSFSFVCSSVNVWNSLSYNVVYALSVQIFRHHLKQHLGM